MPNQLYAHDSGAAKMIKMTKEQVWSAWEAFETREGLQPVDTFTFGREIAEGVLGILSHKDIPALELVTGVIRLAIEFGMYLERLRRDEAQFE